MAQATLLGMFKSFQDSGKRLVDARELLEAFGALMSVEHGIVGAAAAPGPMVEATFNQVASGANVRLPPALLGKQITVVNNGGADLVVNVATYNPYNGGKADTIQPAASSLLIGSNTAAQFVCVGPGVWVPFSQFYVAP
jgi:hypothetical protein